MSKRWTDEELSAYLDGETAQAERIRETLDHSDDASRQYASLQRISDRLRSLREPELDASFADSVVHRIDSEFAEQVSLGRMLGRIKAVPQTEVDRSFADGVLARIASECAEQTALARLLGRIKALPQPNVHPGFARRVIAAIESGAHEKQTRWVPVSGTALAAVAVALVIGAMLMGPLPQTDAPTQMAAPAPEAASPAPLDESALLAKFESRIAADAEIQQIVVARFEPEAEPQDLYSSRLLAAFAGSPGTRAGEAFIRGADYRAALRHMDRAQTSSVKQMLEASVQEAHEG
jgi:negative regulator of sigma E activity